jgi:hypothetical protein
MPTVHSFKVQHHRSLALCALLAVLLILGTVGCRKKESPPLPPGPPVGDWTIELRPPLVMYRDQVGGHVINDTIAVRVFNMQGGVLIFSQATVSHDSVTPSCTSLGDTTTRWWGSESAIVYWGSGGPDGQESVHSWAVLNGDTVADALASFKVMDPL